MFKFWCGSLLLCLLIVLHLQSCVEGQGANEPQMCCFSYYKRKMRQDVIKKYDILRGDCPTAGVVFTTHDGRRVCVERVQGWVQRAMDKIDQQSLEKSRDLSRVNTTTPHN